MLNLTDESVAPCLICAAPTRPIRDFCSDPDVHLVSCVQCGSEQLSPQPSDQVLSREYSAYFSRRGSYTKVEYFYGMLASVPGIIERSSILDLGCGEGYSIAAMRKLSPEANITAVEPMLPKDFMLADPRLVIERDSVETWLDNSAAGLFDCVLAFDFIEHLRNPTSVLSKIVARHMSVGALLVLTCPNVDSCQRRLLGKMWPHYKLEHLWYPSRKGLLHLLGVAGLKAVVIVPHTKRLPIGYLTQVLTEFGPDSTRLFAKLIKKLMPAFIGDFQIELPSSEWFVVAQRDRSA